MYFKPEELETLTAEQKKLFDKLSLIDGANLKALAIKLGMDLDKQFILEHKREINSKAINHKDKLIRKLIKHIETLKTK